jgi:hypothetical protein
VVHREMIRARRVARERCSTRTGSPLSRSQSVREVSRHPPGARSPALDCARSRGPPERVRCFSHGNCTRLHRPSPGSPSPRAACPRRLSRRPLGVRPPAPVGAPRLRVRVRLSAARAGALQGVGVLPHEGRRAASAVPRSSRAAPGRAPLPDQRGGARQGSHLGEPRRGAATVLPAIEAGSEGSRGGASARRGSRTSSRECRRASRRLCSPLLLPTPTRSLLRRSRFHSEWFVRTNRGFRRIPVRSAGLNRLGWQSNRSRRS